MRKTTQWAKVFSILLFLSLVMLNASSVQGKKGGKGTKTPMDAFAWDGDCAFSSPTSPLFSGDTRYIEICPHAGALIPSNNRGFFTSFGRCLDLITFPGDIEIVKGEFGATQDRYTGEVVAIRIWLYDLENNVYATDKIPASGRPDPTYFRITVCKDNIPVFRQNKKQKGKGRPASVGYISVGVIDYFAKD